MLDNASNYVSLCSTSRTDAHGAIASHRMKLDFGFAGDESSIRGPIPDL